MCIDICAYLCLVIYGHVCVFHFMHGEEALPSFCDAGIMAIKSLGSFIFLGCDH